jgi:hypothetical protein
MKPAAHSRTKAWNDSFTSAEGSPSAPASSQTNGMSFKALQDACALTDGNLNRHLHALAETGES